MKVNANGSPRTEDPAEPRSDYNMIFTGMRDRTPT
jgi:hypothetical protein